MAANIETAFLREFAGTYWAEISFDDAACDDLAAYQARGFFVGLADVLFVLQNGVVDVADKTDADGADWRAYGATCHEDHLLVSIKVWCDRYKVRVLSVAILGD